ncbi:MAG: DUF167 domain-containing protein [Desulfobaccales bacterium]
MAEFFLPTCQGYLVKIHVVPGARRTTVAGLHGDRLKVKVAAPPEKGRANEELLAFLARSLQVPLKALQLTSGASSRAKVVAVHDLSPDLKSRLLALLAN